MCVEMRHLLVPPPAGDSRRALEKSTSASYTATCLPLTEDSCLGGGGGPSLLCAITFWSFPFVPWNDALRLLVVAHVTR